MLLLCSGGGKDRVFCLSLLGVKCRRRREIRHCANWAGCSQLSPANANQARYTSTGSMAPPPCARSAGLPSRRVLQLSLLLLLELCTVACHAAEPENSTGQGAEPFEAVHLKEGGDLPSLSWAISESAAAAAGPKSWKLGLHPPIGCPWQAAREPPLNRPPRLPLPPLAPSHLVPSSLRPHSTVNSDPEVLAQQAKDAHRTKGSDFEERQQRVAQVGAWPLSWGQGRGPGRSALWPPAPAEHGAGLSQQGPHCSPARLPASPPPSPAVRCSCCGRSRSSRPRRSSWRRPSPSWPTRAPPRASC